MKSSRLLSKLVVRPAPRLGGWATPARGILIVGPIKLPCAIGATAISHRKREGDKATPAGSIRILSGYFRPDRISRPRCAIPLRPLSRNLGWCDDPASPAYNRPIPLPPSAAHPVGHEVMWREDGLYDVVFVLGYNLAPRRAGRGSAIFMHCARPALTPTLGCVALRPADMRRLLPRLSRSAILQIAPCSKRKLAINDDRKSRCRPAHG